MVEWIVYYFENNAYMLLNQDLDMECYKYETVGRKYISLEKALTSKTYITEDTYCNQIKIILSSWNISIQMLCAYVQLA